MSSRTLKWIAVALGMACALLTSLQVNPANVITGTVSSAVWTYAGVASKDAPLVVSSAMTLVIFFYGVVIAWL